jgi:hypothetical protein
MEVAFTLDLSTMSYDGCEVIVVNNDVAFDVLPILLKLCGIG